MKKIISILLAVVLCLSFATVAFAGSKNGNLQFDKNGRFKMLLVADPQDGYVIKESLTVLLNETLDKTDPDLVIFLGDNVMSAKDHTYESYLKGFDQILGPVVERNIPFTFVFGNHDDESVAELNKEQILLKYQTYKGCLAYEADPALHGCATHNLEILSSDGSKTAFNLWLMDSGDYVTKGSERYYDCVRKDQLQWYEQTSLDLEKNNGGLVPSMMFQHIVPLEVAKSVMITLPYKLPFGASVAALDGQSVTYLPKVVGYKSGLVFEAPCPSRDCEGQWETIVNRGDVLATFFGHDHVNTYKADIDGVDAVNVPAATYQSYHSAMSQGTMLITLNEDDLSTYEAKTYYASDLALEAGSELPGLDGNSKAKYFFAKTGRKILTSITDAIRAVSSIFDSDIC